MPYNKLFINLPCLVFTEKYRTSPYGLGLYKKDIGLIFLTLILTPTLTLIIAQTLVSILELSRKLLLVHPF